MSPRNTTYIAQVKNAVGLASEVPTSTTILFVGDIMLGRNVELLMDQRGDNYPFDKISDYLNSVDIVVANLEGPVLTKHTRTPSNSLSFNFHTRMPDVLAEHNIGIVSLANNHTFDYGKSGYDQTVTYATRAGIDVVGHPFAFAEQYILRKTINNQKFLFIGFNITNPNFDFKKARAFTQTLKKEPGEFMIALVHGGEEYKLKSGTRQQTFYRGLVDDGVEIVIAHHPHVTQEVEDYKGKKIFYSLGNFIFDQYFSKDVQQGLMVKATFSDGKVQYEEVPIKSVRSQPQL
ncbi:CapA family protein [Candidatus Parcubacteria bacterium]|nr:CapA family protein [Candidatus Parcubacteria bacterium]